MAIKLDSLFDILADDSIKISFTAVDEIEAVMN